jgi:hypothetical protein
LAAQRPTVVVVQQQQPDLGQPAIDEFTVMVPGPAVQLARRSPSSMRSLRSSA